MGVFFWLSIVYLTLKYKNKFSDYYDLAFLFVIIFFMSGINMSALSDCGTPGTAILYTIIPWTCIFLPMIVLLYYFPHWKEPFSNTLGYLIISFNKSNIDLLVSLLKNKEQNMMYVVTSPWVLFNQLRSDMFGPTVQGIVEMPEVKSVSDIITDAKVVPDTVNITDAKVVPDTVNITDVKVVPDTVNITDAKVVPDTVNITDAKVVPDTVNITDVKVVPKNNGNIQKGGSSSMYLDALNLADARNIARLKEILQLKEIVSVWLWYMLTALITISTSYTLIMNSACSKEKKEPEKKV